MIGIFRCLARRTTGPPKSPGRPRSPRLEVEVLEQRALPGNVPFGALLLPPGLHATLGSQDAASVPAQTWTDSRGSGGSVSAAAVVAAASAPTNADPPASPHVLSGTDLDSLGGAAPLAIPLARTNPFGGPAIHFDLPGLPTNPPPVGNDPSTINDFNGFIGVAHLQGTGTDGSGNTFNWDADLRFMQGVYQGVDGQIHSGTFAFVWLDLYKGAVAPANQVHDFNPGFSSQEVFWTVALPDSSVQVDGISGKAELKVSGLAIEDYGTLRNALSEGASVPATVSFDVTWSGPVTQRLNVTDAAHTFAGEYAVNQAKASFSASESGFTFTSNAASTSTSLFAETGHERNGIFFS